MTNFTPEMIEKAKAAKSAEELLALAKENNFEMTEEEAKTYYDQLNSKSGELSDDELDNVAGGGCKDPEEKFPEGCTVYWRRGLCGQRRVEIKGVVQDIFYCDCRYFDLHWIEPGKTFKVCCDYSWCDGEKTFSGDPADQGFITGW